MLNTQISNQSDVALLDLKESSKTGNHGNLQSWEREDKDRQIIQQNELMISSHPAENASIAQMSSQQNLANQQIVSNSQLSQASLSNQKSSILSNGNRRQIAILGKTSKLAPGQREATASAVNSQYTSQGTAVGADMARLNSILDQKQQMSQTLQQDKIPRIQSLKDFQLPSITKNTPQSTVEELMTKHRWNKAQENNQGQIDSSNKKGDTLVHQSMLHGQSTIKQGGYPQGLGHNYSLHSINMQNNISSLTARGSDQSEFIKLKKKDEFSGDFFKNIMTARGGSIIQDIRLNQLNQPVYPQRLSASQINKASIGRDSSQDRLTELLKQKNLIQPHQSSNQALRGSLGKSSSTQNIVPFLFSLKKETSSLTNNTHTVNSTDIFASQPIKLNLQEKIKTRDPSQESQSNKKANMYYLTQPNNQSFNKSLDNSFGPQNNKFNSSTYEGYAKELCGKCDYCQHCKCREFMNPNDYLFLDHINFSHLVASVVQSKKRNQSHFSRPEKFSDHKNDTSFVANQSIKKDKITQGKVRSQSMAEGESLDQGQNFSNFQLEQMNKLKLKLSVDKVIDEILQNKRSIKEIIHEETLNKLLQGQEGKLYRGITELKSQELKQLLREVDFDDLSIRFLSELTDSNQMKEEISDTDYLNLINQNYKENIKILVQRKDLWLRQSLLEKPQISSSDLDQKSFLIKMEEKSPSTIQKLLNRKSGNSTTIEKGQSILLPDYSTINTDPMIKYRSLALYIGIQEVIRQLTEAAQSGIHYQNTLGLNLSTVNQPFTQNRSSQNQPGVGNTLINYTQQGVQVLNEDFGKDRGHLLLRLIRAYFDQNELKWAEIVKKIALYNKSLKEDRNLLLGKFDNSSLIGQDVKSVLDNLQDTTENLVAHKMLIKQLVGKVLTEEDIRTKQDSKIEELQKSLHSLVFESEKLLQNQELIQRMDRFHSNTNIINSANQGFKNTEDITDFYIDQISKIQERLSDRQAHLKLHNHINPHIASLIQEATGGIEKQKTPQANPLSLETELCLMINSERLRKMCQQLKSKAEIEKEQLERQEKQLREERIKLKQQAKYFEKQYYAAMEKVTDQQKEMNNLIHFLKTGNQDQKFWQDYFKDTDLAGLSLPAIKLDQTDENLLTNSSMDEGEPISAQNTKNLQISAKQKQIEDRATVTDIVNKVKNCTYFEPISKEQVIESMVHIYSKKAQEMSLQLVQRESADMEFEDTIYSFFKLRYQGAPDKVTQQCTDFLLGLRTYAHRDERVETFAQFLPCLDSSLEQQQPPLSSNQLRVPVTSSTPIGQRQMSNISNQMTTLQKETSDQDLSGGRTGRKYSRDILELYVKLMKCTDASINQIVQSSGLNENNVDKANQAPSFTAKYYFERIERNVLFNASLQIKTQLLRNLVYEADIHIDGKRVPASSLKGGELNNLAVRFELYVLMEFYKATEAVDIQHFAQILEKKCRTTNEYGLASYEEFQKVFNSYISYWDQLVAFQFFSYDDLIQKYFPKSIKNIDGQKYIGFKGMRTFYRQRYELKLDIRKYMNVALKITVLFYQEAKFFYNRIFQQVDTEKRGMLEFHQFQLLIKKIKPDLPQWKIFAIFQSTSNQDKVEAGMITFPQFLRTCLNHSLMEGLMNIDFSSIKDQDEGDSGTNGRSSGLQKHDSGQNKKQSPNIREIKAIHQTTIIKRGSQSISPMKKMGGYGSQLNSNAVTSYAPVIQKLQTQNLVNGGVVGPNGEKIKQLQF